MEGMAVHQGRRGMIGGDDEDVGLEGLDPGMKPVGLLDRPDLGLEIPVLAGGVRFFVMDVEKVMLVPMGLEGVEKIGRLGPALYVRMPINRASPLYIG